MYLPSLTRDRTKFIIIQKYELDSLAAIIFLFLTTDIPYKDIEMRILNKDFKGYLVLDILKYYGLRKEHFNIFYGASYEYVKNAFRDKVLEDEEYEILYNLLNSVTFEKIDIKYFSNSISKESNQNLLKYNLENKEINDLSDEEKEAYFNVISKIRNKRVQDKFRRDLLVEFHCKCALCEVDKKELLIASHIVPYSKCKGIISKAGDVNNGLLLCPIHDALFEAGRFISFNQKGEIVISDKINPSDFIKYKIDGLTTLNSIHMTETRKQYLLEHYNMFIQTNVKS